MRGDKKLKVIVFEDDPVISKLFKDLFVFQCHDVLSFTEPTVCPLFKKTECDCPKDSPCADVLIADMEMRCMSGLDLFKNQRTYGCKALGENKLLLGERLTTEQKNAVDEIGCRFIKKPFNAYEIVKWLEGCAKRAHDGTYSED